MLGEGAEAGFVTVVDGALSVWKRIYTPHRMHILLYMRPTTFKAFGRDFAAPERCLRELVFVCSCIL